MPAAARVGDTTTHGGTMTGPGVATVLIAGRPALRTSDVSGCGAMAALGAPTVLIN